MIQRKLLIASKIPLLYLYRNGIRFFSKHIDSTIRGNVGAEIAGILCGLEPEYVAIGVPAYPRSGRIVIGDYLLVNGIPVERSEASHDSKNPITVSDILKIIKKQTAMPACHISLEKILKNPEIIAKKIKQKVDAGKKIIVFDAISNEDITNIALGLQKSDIKAVVVDPGPFTQTYMYLMLGKNNQNTKGKAMVISASTTSLTRKQFEYLQQEYGAKLLNIDVRLLIDDKFNEDILWNITNTVHKQINKSDIFGLKVAEKEEAVLDLNKEACRRNTTVDLLSTRINNALASIALKVLDMGVPNLKGVYTTGGDMTVAFCQGVKAQAIEIGGEVLPLAAHGILIDGKFPGLQIVTKGRLVGTIESAAKCIEFILNR